MNYTHLGRTGLKVSRLCLGTMNFGDVTDEKTSARILDEALEAGINFIDTADVYGTEQSPDIQQGSGLSEEIIGRWLQQGGRRERIVLATKVYQPMGPGPNDRRLSAYHIRKACEDSLRRLKTDHIDVFDNQGGFYFTDSRGNSADPQGGVFYVSPNVGSIHAILPGLAVGNGIAIDPAGSQIWATEHAKNRLHRVRLSDATTVAPFGSVVTYQFTGPAPDGARVDSEGNVYVAIFIASNYVCDRVLHWYKGNQHAPLNGVMSFFHKQTTFSYASLGPKSV